MKRKLGNTPVVAPLPVLIVATYDENGVPSLSPVKDKGIQKQAPKMITVFGGFVVYLSSKLKMPDMGNPIHTKVRKPEYKPCT